MKEDQLIITSAKTKEDFQGIVALHQKYLYKNLSQEERKHGFVLTNIDFQVLEKVREFGQNRIMIGKSDFKVNSYLITASKDEMKKITDFIKVEEILGKIKYKGKPLSQYNYLYGLQVLVQKQYRKKSIWLEFLNNLRHLYQKEYDFFMITVANQNTASMEANQRVGFVPGQIFISEKNQEGLVLVLEWNNLKHFSLERSQI